MSLPVLLMLGAFTPSTPEVWQRQSWRARTHHPQHTMSMVQAPHYLPQVEEVEKNDEYLSFYVGSDSSGMGSDGSPRDYTQSRGALCTARVESASNTHLLHLWLSLPTIALFD